jgi:hypothetical protein
MKRIIKRGEKIMKGRFFTLIIGLSLVLSGNLFATNDPVKVGETYVQGGNTTIILPDNTIDLSNQGKNGSGTDATVVCSTPIPAVELFKGVVSIHAINKYTQLENNKTVFNYLTTMGIYNGTVANVSFDGKRGKISSWTTQQYTPGYWGTQEAMIAVYANNPWLMMGAGSGFGSSGYGMSNYMNWGAYSTAMQFPRV